MIRNKFIKKVEMELKGIGTDYTNLYIESFNKKYKATIKSFKALKNLTQEEIELNSKIIKELESIEEIDIPKILSNIKGMVK
ncbi:MAG: hypothetical protein ACRC6E_00730 [Fusobacteriaceae bacterium]